MKKSEIKKGQSYTNGKGKVRRVVDIGEQYKLYDAVKDTENLLYEVVCDGSKTNRAKGERHSMTVSAFAAWAKGKY